MVYVHGVVFKSSQEIIDFSPNNCAINEYASITNMQISIVSHILKLSLLLHFSFESLPSTFYCYEKQSVDKMSTKVQTQILHFQWDI